MGTSTARLRETCARLGWDVEYTKLSENGPPHMKAFVVRASLTGRSLPDTLLMDGTGASIKAATEEASRLLLIHQDVKVALIVGGKPVPINHKGLLGEALQQAKAGHASFLQDPDMFVPRYNSHAYQGASHTPLASAKVTIKLPQDILVEATGAGPSKKVAEQEAAAAVLQDPLLLPYLGDKPALITALTDGLMGVAVAP